MNMPGFTAETSLVEASEYYKTGSNIGIPADTTDVMPQACAGTGCLSLPRGRFCIDLPIVGRQCVRIPSTGQWRIRCCTRWGWPPVRCRVSRC